MALLPSPDNPTELPCPSGPAIVIASAGERIPGCISQTLPKRLKTHAPPALLKALGAPTTAVLPSEDSATELPAQPVGPTSLLCWVQPSKPSVKTHAAPT